MLQHLKCKFGLICLILAAALVGLTSVINAGVGSQPARKIIVFADWYINEAAQDSLLNQFGAVKIKPLDLINAKAVYLPSVAAERALAQRSEVKRVDDDALNFALSKPSSPPGRGGKDKQPPAQPAQEPSWGYLRIGTDLANSSGYKGSSVNIGIIDTGIDLSHPDLMDNIKGGINTINPSKSYDDDNGHGSHVAGIAAAADNDIGVIGIAPEANLYAIKVLNRKGIGFTSDIIEGLDWAINNGIAVVNMSLGTASDVQSYHDAIIAAYNAGITIVAAAGNDGQTDGRIYYPAKYPETIAVSAIDQNDGLAYFSSYGAEIDLAAPGQEVNSCWQDGGYHLGSGTSMATPHVTGAAALVLTTSVAAYDLDSDGEWDPVEVKNKLEATAEDLGDSGEDDYFGAGLVDAAAAVQ
jgi:subtilisin